MLTYRQWLSLYGSESCCGCEWNNATKARCNHKGPYCTRYEAYVRDEKRKNTQLSLF